MLAAVLAALATGCSGSSASATGPSGSDVPEDSGATARLDAGDAGTKTPPASGKDAGATGPDAGSGEPEAGMEPSEGGPAPEAGPSASQIEYAPYFPTWVWGGSGYAFTGLADLQNKAGLNEVTIAFVLSNGGCNTTQDIEQNMSDVQAFIAAGGHVKASFGGADGTYVESQCSDAVSLATAIEDFVDATGITDLDFDIEQDPVMTDAVNEMRGEALATVQASKNIRVAFTLAGDLSSEDVSVLSHALSAGVHVSHVNLMTMDYGDSPAGTPMAPKAIASLNAGNAQLLTLVPGMTQAQAWQMLGVIPMIGQNDDSEVFSLDDAKTLAAFAIQNQLGLVSFWSIDRDQVCPKGADYNSCSTVDTANFQFDAIFQMVTAP
jgi:hypothetical protein